MPIDRGNLDNQLKAIGDGESWWEHLELRDLPALLDSEEQVLAMARGKLARVRVLRRPWLFVVTDRRLVCIRSARGSGWRQFDVRGDEIDRVTLRIGPFRGRVIVVAQHRTVRLLVPRPDAYRLVRALSTLGPPAGLGTTHMGPTLLVRRVVDHVLALPAAAFNPGPAVPALRAASAPAPGPGRDLSEQRLALLEEQVQLLQQQVDFMEELLRQRHLPPAQEG